MPWFAALSFEGLAQQVEPPTNPKPVRTVPIKAHTEPIKCENGWTVVLLANGKPMCAREMKVLSRGCCKIPARPECAVRQNGSRCFSKTRMTTPVCGNPRRASRLGRIRDSVQRPLWRSTSMTDYTLLKRCRCRWMTLRDFTV